MLSIPRDLKVNIPGHGVDKFNAAYTLRRAEADREGGQAAHRHRRHQPRRQRQLHRLRRRRQLDRLRVRGRRPPLLPLERGTGAGRAVRGDRHPRRLPAHVRPERPRVRALQARRQRPRARGPPAGVPAPGAPGAAGGRRSLNDFNDLKSHRREVRDDGHSPGDRSDHASRSCSSPPAAPRSSRSTSPPTSAGPPPRT